MLRGVYGTALRAAVIGDHEDLVRNLIIRGADVNLRYKDEHRDKDKGESVLHLALRSRNSAIFKALLVAGADTNTKALDRQHILVVACKHGNPAFVEILLVSGVDINVSGTKQSHADSMPYDEATPLNAACAEGHLSVVIFLLDHGADIEKSNGSSATPLIAAIRGKTCRPSFYFLMLAQMSTMLSMSATRLMSVTGLVLATTLFMSSRFLKQRRTARSRLSKNC